ncbi:MAG: hydantoinase B/oxoprolinase family protein, partial [Pirellulaceae bacterium]
AVRVDAVGRSEDTLPPTRSVAGTEAAPPRRVPIGYQGRWDTASVWRRDQLTPGDRLSGPALVLEKTSTTVIEPGWQGEVLSGGEILLTWQGRHGAAEQVRVNVPTPRDAGGSTGSAEATNDPSLGAVAAEVDPVALEVFHNHFASIAEQMGITLRATSSSVNVKERLDFSCALFTATGDLVVNAPHIPVHLGAMSETVRQSLRDNPRPVAGDVYVTNDPYRGGSHLPDVTVITPVCHASTGELLFVTASRAHHAEIGGITPGSMPPFSRSLAEEGVRICNFKAVDAGAARLDELRALFTSGPFPSRKVDDNLYDVSAQIAANQQGASDLLRLVDRFGWPTVSAYMRHIQSAAEQKMRAALRRLSAGVRTWVDHLDDGSPIAVSWELHGDSARIDFTGSGPVLDGNLNANRAIVTAAVMYCLRCLIDEDIPLNQGVLAPVEIVIPEGLLSPPARDRSEDCAAVAGGNVETSQRVVDVLLGALGLAAASQGTMNNLLFGDGTFGYYETICGGAGATPQGPGADAVHTHMTNTRLTDPEVLEHRFPVRLREFRIRRGSGGAGMHRGGDGVVRQLEFLKPLELSLLSQRRGPYRPYGAAGGAAGLPGSNTLVRLGGQPERLPGIARTAVEPGDVLTVETPGGGGWGAPASP